MILKRFSHLLLVLALVAATTFAPFQKAALAQSKAQTAPAAQTTAPDLATRLGTIEKALDEKRQELHIPGVSFVIVKDDKVIYMKGLGFKDVERKLPLHPTRCLPSARPPKPSRRSPPQ